MDTAAILGPHSGRRDGNRAPPDPLSSRSSSWSGPVARQGGRGASQRRTARSARAARSSRGPTAAHVEGLEGDDADRGLDPTGRGLGTGRQGQRESVRPGLQLARRCPPRRSPRATGEDRPAGRSLVERVPRAGAVGDVDVGPRRLDDDEGERLVPLGDRQVRRRADGVGELAQHGPGLAAHDRRDGGGEAADAERETHPPVGRPRDEVVLLERRDEAVDDGSPDPEPGRELGDRQARRLPALGERLEHADAAVERLGGLSSRRGGTGHPVSPRSARRRPSAERPAPLDHDIA